MYYTIYKTYNLINGKEYIGKHQTQNINDNYVGSGKYLKRAIRKYGEDNFIKDILYVFNTEQEMNSKEKELVSEEYINSKLSYNLCPGGYGGFGYVNKNGLNGSIDGRIKAGVIGRETLNKKLEDPLYKEEYSRILSKAQKLRFKLNPPPESKRTLGMKFSDETKKKMSASKIGAKNSQYGTCWITNGSENKKIKKEELALYINQGYYRGMIVF